MPSAELVRPSKDLLTALRARCDRSSIQMVASSIGLSINTIYNLFAGIGVSLATRTLIAWRLGATDDLPPILSALPEVEKYPNTITPHIPKKCEACEDMYEPNRVNQRWCGPKCRRIGRRVEQVDDQRLGRRLVQQAKNGNTGLPPLAPRSCLQCRAELPIVKVYVGEELTI